MRHMVCRLEYFEILLMSFIRILYFHEGEWEKVENFLLENL